MLKSSLKDNTQNLSLTDTTLLTLNKHGKIGGSRTNSTNALLRKARRTLIARGM